VDTSVNTTVIEAPDAGPPAEPEHPATKKPAPGALTTLQSLSVTVTIAIFVITFLVQAFQIPSESMENTLLIGDFLLVDKVQYGPTGIWGWLLPYKKIKRGDIVVFRWPVHPEQHFVKRVVGAPGDRVKLVNGQVQVNGVPVTEDYVVHKQHNRDIFRDEFPSTRFISPQVTAQWWKEFPQLTRNSELLVPEDNYFVLGDNRDESLDSRYWGLVPRENIIGRPLLIYWSFKQPGEDAAIAVSPDGKIGRFAYTVWHLPQLARWDRTMRVIK
jgi:signal peptidase I